MTTHTGYVMTLANSIIGVSLLAMPYCFKQCGLILGIILLVASNIITRLACHFLVKSALMCRRKNYEFVGYHAFGESGKLLVEVGVIGFLMGTAVAFFVVIGDLAPAILSKLFYLENNESLRTTVLFVTGLFIILPLSLLRNIESLAAISTVTMLFYVLLVSKVFAESFAHLAAADWLAKVNLWRPEGILQCFPIFSMALSCQTQVFEILEVLPSPSLERMNTVVLAAVNLCTGLYVAVGFFGYVAYSGQTFGGNVLLSFSSSTISDLFQLGFVFSIALSFPIVVFPCRASLNSFLFNKGAQYQELNTAAAYIPDVRFKLLTFGVVITSLTTGLFIPNIEFVLGFVGSTIGVVICIIFPAAAFTRISGKNTTERLMAKCVLALGLVAMILGVYGNLDAAVDSSLQHQPGDGSPLLHSSQPPLLPLNFFPPLLEKDVQLERAGSSALGQDMPQKPREPPDLLKPVEAYRIVLQKSQKKEELQQIPAVKIAEKPIEPPLVEKTPLPGMAKSNETPQNKNNVSKVEVVDSVPLEKKVDSIHHDAIAKEEHQLKEDDKIEKKEEERQGKELLQKLKEHKEEQKQLLKEQQNILEEIKIRDGAPPPPPPAESVEPIQPQKFDENIEKIQEVIDDLKERKQTLDKTKGEKIAEAKKKNAEKKSAKSTEQSAAFNAPISKLDVEGNVKASIAVAEPFVPAVVIPESIVGAIPDPPMAPAAGRDILAVNTAPTLDREKRDVTVEDGSCDEHEPKKNSPNVLHMHSDKQDNFLKEAKMVSAPDALADPLKDHADVASQKIQPNLILPHREETRRKRR